MQSDTTTTTTHRERLLAVADILERAKDGREIDLPAAAGTYADVWPDDRFDFETVNALTHALFAVEPKTPADYAALLRVALISTRLAETARISGQLAYFRRLMKYLAPADGERWWAQDEENL